MTSAGLEATGPQHSQMVPQSPPYYHAGTFHLQSWRWLRLGALADSQDSQLVAIWGSACTSPWLSVSLSEEWRSKHLPLRTGFAITVFFFLLTSVKSFAHLPITGALLGWFNSGQFLYIYMPENDKQVNFKDVPNRVTRIFPPWSRPLLSQSSSFR